MSHVLIALVGVWYLTCWPIVVRYRGEGRLKAWGSLLNASFATLTVLHIVAGDPPILLAAVVGALHGALLGAITIALGRTKLR